MKRLALILICLLLQACSATTKGLGDSLWDSLFGTPGVQLTDDDIQNMPYASQYMQLNGGPQLFMVLAFSENGQQKWVTQDGATIVTQHGRLVKTLLGGDNLIDVNNLATDPLVACGGDRRRTGDRDGASAATGTSRAAGGAQR